MRIDGKVALVTGAASGIGLRSPSVTSLLEAGSPSRT
jgi:NAD(P)-dependent dehydrogenase (short-subunit alcohol dehydrogenase family)